MKRFLLLISAMLSVITSNAHDVEIGGIYYNVDVINKTAEVTFGDNLYAGDVVIPASITYNRDLYVVNSIGTYAFRDCEKLDDVALPNSILSIKDYSFRNSSIDSIHIPKSVKTVSNVAFLDCDSLQTIYWDIKSYYDLSDYSATTFYNIRNNIKRIYFGEEVEKIPQFLCYEMQNLTLVSISNNVTSIGYGAFKGCNNLKSLIIPENVVEIVGSAFEGCKGLSSIVIPNSVRTIGSSAFEYCSGLTSVTLGKNIEQIGTNAFSYCKNIDSVMIYSLLVPKAYENSFMNYNATLYVPCEVYVDYFLDEVFGSFKYNICFTDETDDNRPTSAEEVISDVIISSKEGLISCLDSDFKIYNIAGQNVTSLNGNLTHGVYVVKVDNNFVKVMVH